MKKIKIADAPNKAIDWLVAKAEGYRDANDPTEHEDPEEALGYHNWALMREPGVAAKWLSDLCYTTDPAQAWPIIERERLAIEPYWSHDTDPRRVRWKAFKLQPNAYHLSYFMQADTSLIAAMRCYCVKVYGEEAEVPEELLVSPAPAQGKESTN